jgi:hypothetical protein
MKLSLAFVLLAGAGWAADLVPMDVKTGQWEATVTMQMPGAPQGRQMPQFTPEQLAQIPAAQRAQIEAAMKQAAGGPRTTTTKNCVKKEDLTKLPLNPDQNCKMTVITSSSSRQEIHMDCDRNGNKQTATMVIERVSSDSLKFNIQSAGTDSGKTINMTMSGTSKWVSPNCDAK